MTFDETLHRLFERRILLCDEIINDACVGRLRVGFINLNLLSGEKPIRLYIDTRSGDVDEALRLVSTMYTIDAPIVGLVDGRCEALGLALLQSCDVRLMTRFAHHSKPRKFLRVPHFGIQGMRYSNDIHCMENICSKCKTVWIV